LRRKKGPHLGRSTEKKRPPTEEGGCCAQLGRTMAKAVKRFWEREPGAKERERASQEKEKSAAAEESPPCAREDADSH